MDVCGTAFYDEKGAGRIRRRQNKVPLTVAPSGSADNLCRNSSYHPR